LISAAENATLNGLDEVNKVAEEYLKKAPPPPPRKMWNDPTAGSSASAEAEESAWPRTKATGELLVDVYEANEPPVARLPTSQPPAEWERLWKGSDWLCTEVGGDWSAFLYAQGVSWLLVNAMGATNWGVGSEMKLHMPSWREMHGEAFMRGLPSVPGVDTHQWQHYYYDWQPYVASIPLAPDQAWRGAWLEDGTPAGRLEVSRAATLDPSPRGGLLPRPLP